MRVCVSNGVINLDSRIINHLSFFDTFCFEWSFIFKINLIYIRRACPNLGWSQCVKLSFDLVHHCHQNYQAFILLWWHHLWMRLNRAQLLFVVLELSRLKCATLRIRLGRLQGMVCHPGRRSSLNGWFRTLKWFQRLKIHCIWWLRWQHNSCCIFLKHKLALKCVYRYVQPCGGFRWLCPGQAHHRRWSCRQDGKLTFILQWRNHLHLL